MPDLPHLPHDLVFDRILQLLPTKAAVQASFLSKEYFHRGMTSSSVLNFDEYDDFNRHHSSNYFYDPYYYCVDHDYLRRQHNKFINFLVGYLEFCDQNHKYHQLLDDKLRLHMMTYVYEDASVITKLLERALERGVKEMDVSFGIGELPGLHGLVMMYHFPWKRIFVNEKYLTSLHLGGVEIEGPPSASLVSGRPRLPFLKAMWLRNVMFNHECLSSLLSDCPSIECLSLIGCSATYHSLNSIISKSLRSLEVKYCNQLRFLVERAENLESFTFISLPPPNSRCDYLLLQRCNNLKKINICVNYLKQFCLTRNRHPALQTTVISRYLRLLEFSACMTDDIDFSSVKACRQVRIRLVEEDLCNNQHLLSYDSKHFSTLIGFLQRFRCCKEIFLRISCDFKALTFPETNRNMFPAPLPTSCVLVVIMPNPPIEATIDYFDLMDSLSWIAPCAWIAIWPENHLYDIRP